MKNKTQEKPETLQPEDTTNEDVVKEDVVNDEASATEPDDGAEKGPQNEANREVTLHKECHDKIATLESRLEESNDKFLRLFSEFDNYRKRTTKERIELTKTATADMIATMLPVLDDLERAASLKAVEVDADAVTEGLTLILNKFKSILRQKGVEEINAIGEVFSTDLHEAVTHIPAEDEQSKGKVIDEVQKGYLLNGKVIRYARVVVAN
jgi:molecular chaperone GrpE